jgi:hypothetical protein
MPRPTATVPRVLAGLVTAAALSALAAPPAHAAPGVQFGLTDDAWIADGPGTLDQRLARLQQIGVRLVRFSLQWNQIARQRPLDATDPNDTAYDWSADDPILEGLRTRGIGVVLQLVGTPAWANGDHPPNYAPMSGATFAAFARAAAKRYPWVKRWLIWNEPNQARWLRPTNALVYTTRLLNPAYAAIHATIAGAQVGGGVTAPRGSTNGVSPVDWIGRMYAAHARLDAYAHNPYPLDPRRETPLKGGCSYCRTITMATIGRLVALVARDFGRARIWLTEYGYQTNPPDRLLGVAPALQARYLGEGAYQAWRTPRVDMLIHFLFRDEPNVERFQSGLISLSNVPKPAYTAFELPLAQVARRGTRTSLWGQLRAPETGLVARLQERRGFAWVTIATLRGSPAGYLRWTGTLPVGTSVRLRARALVGAAIAIT